MPLFSKMGTRFLRRLGGFILGGLLLTVVAYGVFLVVVRHKEGAAAEAWATLATTWTQPTSRFSSGLTNSTAVALQQRMVPLGLNPLPRKPYDEHPLEEPWTDIMNRVHGYIEEQVERPQVGYDCPSPALSRLLEGHSADLAALRTLLLSDPSPRWAVDLQNPWQSQPIHFLAVTGLGEWLLADALESHLGGRRERAAQDLEAAWVLLELLLDRPEVNAQASALSLAREMAGILRKVDVGMGIWGERLSYGRFRTGLEASLFLSGEGYLRAARRIADQPYFGRGARRERVLWKTFGRLWYRYSMADASLQVALELKALSALGECAAGYRDSTRALAGSGNRLGALGRLGLPDFGIQWTSLMQLRLEMELTRKILDLKSRKGADGRWPGAPEGIELSECPGVRWTYEVAPDGSMFLTIQGGPRSPVRRGAVDLPPTFSAPGTLVPVWQ